MNGAMRHGRGIRRMAVALVAAVLLAIVLVEPAIAGPRSVVSHGPRTGKVVALTIDDGYSPKACRAIFDILERRHVPATFFPVANAMRAAPALWREIADRGYPIGDHTANHTRLAGESVAVQQAAIAAGRATVMRITGTASIRVLRPPAAEWDGNTENAAARAGEQLILLWDTTLGDTSSHRVESHLIRNGTRGRSGSVILMHCNHMISADVLERIIDSYRARGFTFVTIPQLFGLPGPVPVYPDVPPAVGHRAPGVSPVQSFPLATASSDPTSPSTTAASASAGPVTGTAGVTPIDRSRPDAATLLAVCGALLAIAVAALLSLRLQHRRPVPKPAAGA